MLERKLKFVKPSKNFRELALLTEIEGNSNISQRVLAKEAMISSTMVNNYLFEMEAKGLVYANGETNRSFEYHLTENGARHRNDLFFEYSREVIQLYGAMKQEFKRRLLSHFSEGIHRVVLFGASGTGELVYIASKETPIDVVGVVDNDATKHGKKLVDLAISHPSSINELRPDAVIITSFGHMDEICQQLKNLVGEGIKVKKL